MYETSQSLSCRRQAGFMCTREHKVWLFPNLNSIFGAESKKQDSSLQLSVNFSIFAIAKTYNYAQENIHHITK